MKIPDSFFRKARVGFGQAGSDWVRELPSHLSECQERWQLTHLQPVENLSINLVCYAQSAIYGDVVLKLQGPHAERQTEVTALQLFEGQKVCKLHAVELETGALLLERIMPGSNLRALPGKLKQLEIGAELVAQLPVQISVSHGLPTYRRWITNALEIILPQNKPDQRLIELMNSADKIYSEIAPPGSPQYLLHGDLHHDNILQSQSQGWKVIDPHGVIGLPYMESARFIQNHILGKNNDLNFENLDETVAFFARRLEQPKQVISSALFILHALSTCWDVEMNYPPIQTASRIDECELLLEYSDAIDHSL